MQKVLFTLEVGTKVTIKGSGLSSFSFSLAFNPSSGPSTCQNQPLRSKDSWYSLFSCLAFPRQGKAIIFCSVTREYWCVVGAVTLSVCHSIPPGPLRFGLTITKSPPSRWVQGRERPLGALFLRTGTRVQLQAVGSGLRGDLDAGLRGIWMQGSSRPDGTLGLVLTKHLLILHVC